MKFFIYEDNISFCKKNSCGKYAIEIDNALKFSTHEQVLDPNKAQVFFTNICNERNYEIFASAHPEKIENIDYFEFYQRIINLEYKHLGPHFVFFHRFDDRFQQLADYLSNEGNIVNIPYHNPYFQPNKDFIISPPAIKKTFFNDNLSKNFLLSFKGNWGIRSEDGEDHRLKCLNTIAKQNKNYIVITDSKDARFDYIDLLSNSLFSLIPEGDEPWTYRLSEAICAGSIPVLLEKDWRNLPYSNIIDYDNFALRINFQEPELVLQTIMQYSLKEISSRIEYMKSIKHLFSSRSAQIQCLLDFYEENIILN